MRPLADCRFRQADSPAQRWRCTCPHLAIPRTLVTSADCEICPVANQLVSGEAPFASAEAPGFIPARGLAADSGGASGASRHADAIAHVSYDVLADWPRHLIYHVYPVRGSVWRENIDELRRRMSLFTGCRIVSVVLDDTTESRDLLAKELAGLGADIRWHDNDRRLGEAVSLLPTLPEILELPGLTFYAHAKGVTHRDPSVVFSLWARRMYALLDRFQEVSRKLVRCAFCGLIRATGQPVAEGRHEWHYPGSFYWFRNDVVSRRGVSFDGHNRFFPEQFPSQVARFTESAALRPELLKGNPYLRETWEQLSAASAALPSLSNQAGNFDWRQSGNDLPHPMTDDVPSRSTGNPGESSLQTSGRDAGTSFPLVNPPQVAIVIAGRNNGQFLAEAIESALVQTIPCEVVYADDCSIDDSLRVASGYLQRGLRVLPGGVHRGVCDARNRGARATLAENLIFLDADDCLPSDYAAKCLDRMGPGTPFVYSATHAFGSLINHFWPVTPWAAYDLWRHNQVNTSALWARWAFVAAGEWQDDIPTMWDFDLAIRCSRFGTPVPSATLVGYRTHAASFSVALNERDGDACIPYKEMIRRKNARLGIGCLVSGRLPGLFPRWMDAVACSARWAMRFGVLKHRPRLHLLLHGKATRHFREFQEAASRYLDTLEAVDIREIEHQFPDSPESERHIGSATLLAKASAAMQSQSAADVFWLIEDDILVPIRACAWLFREITAGANPPHGVSGVYRNRHVADRCVGGWHRFGRYQEPSSFEVDMIQPVDFTGTGCLMFWTGRPETPRHWRTHTRDGQPAHDFCWGDDLRLAGGRLLMHGGIRCAHARTEVDFLEC
jgi:glycosyltransferase involved in cell wall biosynthesis